MPIAWFVVAGWEICRGLRYDRRLEPAARVCLCHRAFKRTGLMSAPGCLHGQSYHRIRSFELVPGEGLEPPTFGLQNRCTAAVLTRHLTGSGRRKPVSSVAASVPLLPKIRGWSKQLKFDYGIKLTTFCTSWSRLPSSCNGMDERDQDAHVPGAQEHHRHRLSKPIHYTRQ
jgi:hypothetical protein